MLVNTVKKKLMQYFSESLFLVKPLEEKVFNVLNSV